MNRGDMQKKILPITEKIRQFSWTHRGAIGAIGPPHQSPVYGLDFLVTGHKRLGIEKKEHGHRRRMVV